MHILRVTGMVVLLVLSSAPDGRAITSEYDLDAYLPRESALPDLKQQIQADPENKNNYYAYAQMAVLFGKLEEAAWAYDQLLQIDPNLDRIRLDLSLIYVSLGRYKDARELLDTVLAKDPPEAVQENIRAVLAKIDEAERRHHLAASLMAGIGSDSNANAAPGSGNILVLDTIVPLEHGTQPRSDLQEFGAVTASHTYYIGRIADRTTLRWQSNAITYFTRQHALSELNLQLYGIRSGPEFLYEPWETRFALTGGYNYLLLDKQSYLRDPNIEFLADFPLYRNLRGVFSSLWEYREFINSQTVSTYTDRAGQAWQTQFSLRYPYSETQLWEAIVTLRNERAKQNYYANEQMGIALNHTYAFSPELAQGWLADFFTTLRAGYKQSRYDAPDSLVSVKTRNDRERSLQAMLGRKLPYNLVLSAAYAYTNVLSNIENYQYSNHRYTLTITRNF